MVTALALALGGVPGVGRAEAATVVIACGAVGQEADICRQGAEAWARAAGHTVKLLTVPTDAGQQLAQLQQLLAAGSADLDVVRIDVVWPGIVGRHLIDLRPHVPEAVLGQHFPRMVANDTVEGRLVAVPWFTDAGLLYYRKDLLERHGRRPPATWVELAETARAVVAAERAAGQGRLVGYVFQGKAYEGLTCNALEWIDAFGGGTIVDEQGRVTVNNPRAVEALAFVASLVGPVAPRGVLGYDEEATRGVFQKGDAVFMRNWPYAWALAGAPGSPVAGKVGVMALPRGKPDGKTTGTLGGWQLGVSRYSRHPEVAADLVRYLTSPEEQRRRALAGAFNPTIVALYRDAALLAGQPFIGRLYATLAGAVARPTVTGARYNQVSAEFRNGVHATLAGRGTAGDNLRRVEARLRALAPSGTW